MTREQAQLLLQIIHIAVEKAVHAAKHGGYVNWGDLESISEELLDSTEDAE